MNRSVSRDLCACFEAASKYPFVYPQISPVTFLKGNGGLGKAICVLEQMESPLDQEVQHNGVPHPP